MHEMSTDPRITAHPLQAGRRHPTFAPGLPYRASWRSSPLIRYLPMRLLNDENGETMAVHVLTADQLRDTADQMSLPLTDKDVQPFMGILRPGIEAYNLIDQMPDNLPLARSWGSDRDGRWGRRSVGGLEALPEAGAERAVVDRAADLEQPAGAAPRPAHLLRLVHSGSSRK
jgi:hypothetical protein